VWVKLFEEWKHVKLGLFPVLLPGDQQMLIATSEKLECDLKASFGIVIGAPGDDREDRLDRATVTCPATRSMNEKDRIELVPFFRDWATNHCRMAILNTVGKSQYVRLFEEPEYRAQLQTEVEAAARQTLEQVGMLLVQCTVVIEPREPKGIFATPDILARWQKYTESIHDAELKKLEADYGYEEDKKILDAKHDNDIEKLTEQQKRDQAELRQATEFKLRELALELRRKEAGLAIQEQGEADRKDKEVGAILEEMAKRAQDLQLARIRREAELQHEREIQEGELAAFKRHQEQLRIEHQKQMLAEEKAVAEKQVELLSLKEQLNTAEVDLEQRKGKVSADNVERDVLAKGAHEMRMQQLLLQSLPAIVEQAARPAEKIGEIRVLNVSGGQSFEPGAQGGIGSMIAFASALPVIREIFHFLHEFERPAADHRAGKERSRCGRKPLVRPNSRSGQLPNFSEPGEYVLQAVVDDGSGELAGNFGYHCCWTNTEVKVTVKGSVNASAQR